MPNSTLRTPHSALALLEIGNLTPALLVADRCVKAAAVRIIGIESADSAAQCIKLVGSADAVRHAAEVGMQVGLAMVERLGGKLIMADVIPRPHPELAALLPK